VFLPQGCDVAELLIPPCGVRAHAPPLPDMGPQGESHPLEQSPYRVRRDGEPPLAQAIRQLPATAPYPRLLTFRAPCYLIVQQVLQRRRDRRVFLLRPRPPGALLADLPEGTAPHEVLKLVAA